MITSTMASVEMVCVIILAVFALAANDRIYASILGAILSSMLSGVLGYQLLFGMIRTENMDVIQDTGLGYFCMMIAVMIFVLVLAIIADQRIKRREARDV